MKNITAKTAYDGVAATVPSTAVHTNDEYNDRRAELENSVTASGQTLDVSDTNQLSKAMFVNGVSSSSMVDSGAANSLVLTPITSVKVATPIAKDYSLLDGAIFVFKASATNSGNVTVNVGQTVGTLIGSQPLYMADGATQIPAGTITADSYYTIIYDLTSTSFSLINNPKAGFGAWDDSSYLFNTIYTAATAGFVVAYGGYSGGVDPIRGYTPDTVLRTNNSYPNPYGTGSGICMPVRKGDTWKVVLSNTTNAKLAWIPLELSF